MHRHSIVCQRCGRTFGSRRATAKFCSDSCRLSALHKRDIVVHEQRAVAEIEYRCERCGVVFSDLPSQPRRYCSRACQHAAAERRVEHTCAHCGARFERPASVVSRYCSRPCYEAARVARADDPDAFWARVDKTGDCWLWTGSRLVSGYGVCGAGVRGKTDLAHHRAWELTNGPLPEGTEVLMHACDNPPCVRPDHLRPGTHADNVRDMLSKGRARNGYGPITGPAYDADLALFPVAGTAVLTLIVREHRLEHRT